MDVIIDPSFDFYSDTPKGKDPDSHSPTLRTYHRMLWSKPLPDGRRIELETATRGVYLRAVGPGIDMALSSDSIGHTYRYVRSMAGIIGQFPSSKIQGFYRICSTIGAYVVFPSDKIGGKMTINGARGMNPYIKDRFDLTLECIRRYYIDQDSPLYETFKRYEFFFGLFSDFNGYLDFFYSVICLIKNRGLSNFSSHLLTFPDHHYPPMCMNMVCI